MATAGPSPSGWSPYCGPAPDPAAWLTHWNFDPILLGVVGALGAWCFFKRDRIAERRLVALAFCIVLLLFVSPLCALGSALFAARAAHHVLLSAVLAPVLALVVIRNGRAKAVGLPLATTAHALTFWAWHLPSLYAAALSSDALFWLMQGTITGTALLLWIAVLRVPASGAVAALLATMVQMGALGALLTFAARPLYAPHWASAAAWGLSPLEDQQLAGLLMSAPGSLIYLLAAVTILYRSLQPRPAA